MATIVLGAIGNAIFPGLGGLIGAAAGSYLDANVLFPLAFGGPKPIQGSRLADRSISLASEGTPKRFCMGPQCRVGGQYIFGAPLVEREVDQTVGGGSHIGGQQSQNFVYYADFAVAFADIFDRPIDAIDMIWADAVVIYDHGVKDSRLAGLSTYLGTQDQMPDPLIESYKGAGNVPAYRKDAYCVFNHLAVGDWGNHPPQMQALVRAHTALSVADAIGILLLRAGMRREWFDVSQVDGCLLGYAISGPQPTNAVLDQLMFAFNLLVQERNGQLVFFHKGNERRVRVRGVDLAAAEEGTVVPYPAQNADTRLRNDPSEVVVTYIDPALQWQSGGQVARRNNTSWEAEGQPTLGTRKTKRWKNVLQTDLAITMPASQAQLLARRSLYAAMTESRETSVNIPPSYVAAGEGDVLVVPLNNRDRSLRISKIDRGANFQLSITGNVTQSQTSALTSDDDLIIDDPGNPGSGSPPYVAGDLQWVIQDGPAESSSEVEIPGFYFAAASSNQSNPYHGAGVYISANGVAYSYIEPVQGQASMGVMQSVLPAGVFGYWDRTTVIEVVMTRGELSSATADAVLAGVNHAVIGAETVGFQTATLVSTGRYRLSNFLRGLRGTEWAIGAHAASEVFVLLQLGGTGFHRLPLSDLGRLKYVKIVASGGDVGAATPKTFTFQGGTLRQFAPCAIKAVRDTFGSVVFSWCRRSRDFVRLFDMNKPLNAPVERYAVDIMDGGTVLRHIEGATPSPPVQPWPFAVYNAGDQATDGFSPGDPITIEVYQYNDQIKGYHRRVTL